ncbi:hypothetical protein [Psychrilyobacter atlanticus]|uniref:hypothetical protein n=1 Tax=Psychrilyobacter atlanticus TaxID=271091 RepID=UPI0003F88AD0|nr:hypothetical protein [Psychrilyobacter atlanticus]
MSVRNLEQEIKRRITEAVKGIQLINDKGEFVLPLVETGALPKSAVRGEPYILIQTTHIEDKELSGIADINILYGTIGLSREREKSRPLVKLTHATGHWDVLSVIDKIREDFFKDTNFQFGILKRSMKHEVYGEIEFPHYLGETKCTFEIAVTQPQDDYL